MSDLLGIATQGETMPAKYERVAEGIRQQIRSGQLKPGDALPTTEQLLKQYEVSYGTLRSALLILLAEGVIESRPGEGRYVK